MSSIPCFPKALGRAPTRTGYEGTPPFFLRLSGDVFCEVEARRKSDVVMKKLFLFLVCVCLSMMAFAITYNVYDNGDGTCALTGIKGHVSGKVELPNYVNGLKVTCIDSDFRFDEDDEEKITELVIPDTVTEFYRYTFAEVGSSNNAITITLPHTLEHIWEWKEHDSLDWFVFNADYVKSIKFSNGSTSNDVGTYCLIGEENRMLVHCEDASSTNLIAYAGSLGIEDDGYCRSPETITVPDGVTSMACFVFDDMETTKKISFPESLTELRGGDYGLGWVTQLEEIEVRGTKSPYQVIGDSLVDMRTKTLIQATKNTIIPNDGSIKIIGGYSFINDLIGNIVIPDAVEEIAEYAVRNAYRIETIRIGKGTKVIGGGAFAEGDAETIKCISISPENLYYEVVNGCVIRKEDNFFVSTGISHMAEKVSDEEGDYDWKYDVEVPYFCEGILSESLDEDENVRIAVLPKDLALEYSSWVDPIGVQGICIADCTSIEEAKASDTYKNFENEGYLDTDEELTISFTSNPQVAVRTVGAVTVEGYGRYTPETTVTLKTTYVEDDKQVVWYKVDRENNTRLKVATGNTYSFTMPSDNVFYSAEVSEGVEAPVITPTDGTTCAALSCTVTISCATDGAAIYYTTNGVTPRLKDEYLYTDPFEITGEAKIVAVASKNGVNSKYVEATITCEELTLAGVLDESKLVNVTTAGDAEWEAVTDTSAKEGSSVAKSGTIGKNQSSWLEAAVYDKGTLSFWWKVSCEPDEAGRYTYDHIAFSADGEVKARLDGEQSVWQEVSVTFNTYGIHTLRWEYKTDNYEEEGYQDCAWVDGVSWTGEGTPVLPSVDNDTEANVTLDAEKGYVITPSEGAKEVKVTIPDGVDAAKVTVKVSPEAKVTPNGAAVKVVKGEHDITTYLDIPATDASGVIDLSAATVKEEYVKEPFNVEKGAKIDLSSTTEPSFTTAPTQKGLTYRLKEGTTLEEMRADTDGDSKIGDGSPWTPTISEKGGTSAFYTIEVTK